MLKTIPTEINDITSLKRLSLGSNQLQGNIDFSNLTNITSLGISYNQIIGLKLGVAPTVFNEANVNGYTNRFSFSGNSHLHCIAVPQSTITDWQNSSYATSYPNIAWGEDCTTYNNVPMAELQALVAMYTNLDGVNWRYNSNWKDNTNAPYNVTTWQGITTEIINGSKHVTRVSLGNNNLKGTLQTSLGNLTELKNLNLSSNEISGAIPTSIGNLTKLEQLTLYSNQLESLPTEMNAMTALQTVSLYSNQIVGKLPNFTGATNLTTLNIQNNKFQFGDFEDEFTPYSALQSFNYNP